MALRAPHSFFYFSAPARSWVPAISNAIQRPGLRSPVLPNLRKHRFDIASWNINCVARQPSRRCLGIINHIVQNGMPDILCLQEVKPEVRATLLGSPQIRDNFLTTDAEPDLEDKPFTTMTMLSRRRFAYTPEMERSADEDKFIVWRAFREQLPSATGRDGLYVDFAPPYARDSFLRVANVHLESRDTFFYREQQLQKLARALYEPGCSGGLIAGDFNSITEEDHQLIERNRLIDAWLTLSGNTKPGGTSGVGWRNRPSRLDKIAMVGLLPESMQLMHPLFIDAPKPGETSDRIRWSDHSGIRCRFYF